MTSIWLFVILALNFGISWWNCYACGSVWAETKALGGVIRFLVWCGVIQAAVGFSSVFLFPLIFVAHWAVPEYFTELYVKGAINLWYITVIFPVLGTGLALTIHSWVVAFRERSMLSMGTAAWNTYAQISNTYSAVQNLGSAFSSVGEAFGSLIPKSGDSDDAKAALAIWGVIIMVAIVILALAAGSILTAILIHRYAATRDVPEAAARHYARARAG